MDEIAAIRRLKVGDFGGLEYLMARYQVKAMRAAVLITRDQAGAEDVVQEVFLRMFQRPTSFDERRPFEPYLMRSVINAALNASRDEQKSISIDGNLETVERLIAQAASVESQVECAQVKNELSDALGKLPPRQRAVIVQRYYLEMSEKEMAQSLDAAPGTVKWLLNTARAGLRELLKKERI
jgi:RNA polymerase sigma-70 factor, ECF subfamily